MIAEKMLQELRNRFGGIIQENVLLSNFTTMNVGGPADALIVAHSANQLADTIQTMWKLRIPFVVLGSGSNLLVSDKGIRGVAIINHAHNIKIDTHHDPITVWAESGALMVNIGKKLILRGLSGMEWAATIPGTVGGAVYGNAGAFGKETCRNLVSADVLHKIHGRDIWDCDRFEYSYRSSNIKRNSEKAIVLSATFSVEQGDMDEVKEKMSSYKKRRAKIQPPGPSVGSVFRNPINDKAGRLIEAVGLKGRKIGGGIISPKHANFIINLGGAKAQDIFDLIIIAQDQVLKEFGVSLVPEIELIGEWEHVPDFLESNIHRYLEDE